MSTTKTPITATLMELPIMKHFNESDIVARDPKQLNKGASQIFGIIRLLVLAAMGYAVWTYAIPPIMAKLGATIGSILSVIAVILTIFCAKPILRWCKNFSRWLNKKAINQDPFLPLEEEKVKVMNSKTTFDVSKAGIDNLKNDFEVEASKAEQQALKYQEDILKLHNKAKTLQARMEEIVQKDGAEGRNSDEYNDCQAQQLTVLSESARVTAKMNQKKEFTTKYATRAAIMKKLAQKLVMVGVAIDIKIADFDATIEMLKEEYKLGQKTKNATQAAKGAMMFDKSWEFDYALEVIHNTIAYDTAITASNLKDINSITSQYNLDSDELYNNLDALADKIKVGADVVPSTKKYMGVDYKFTSEDKMASGAFRDLM